MLRSALPLKDDDWGGWTRNANLEKLLDTSRCTIDVRSNLSSSEFVTEYVQRSRPVMLRGPAAYACTAGWDASTRWREANFVAHYGEVPIGDGPSGNAAYRGTQSVAQAIARMHREPPAIYRWSSFTTENITHAALRDVRVPPIFAESLQPGDSVQASLFMTSPGQGAGWHNHGDALNALVFGRKRWFLYGPMDLHETNIVASRGSSNTNSNGRNNFVSQQWFFEVLYPRLHATASEPLECVQRRGDLVYVPSDWAHMTLSIGASVASTFLRNSGWGETVATAPAAVASSSS